MKDLFILFFWIVLGGVSAYYARERGRNPYIWFFIGLVFGILGLILLFILPKKNLPRKIEEMEELIEITPVKVEPPAHHKKFWYYLDEQNQQFGPMSFDKLKVAFQEGTISISTYTWYEELDQWKPLNEVITAEELNG